ncbi:MAG TPA: type II secretion system F family protein, partial [Gammaproteobacteria bacterium]|nr:type II secretion system F family protein [Gammaproteobacteria bacterium]
MSAFHYRALKTDGHEVNGLLEGDSARQVRQMIREQGLAPIEVTQVSKRKKIFAVSLLRSQVSIAELALVTRQLATLLNAGMPLEEVLLAASEQTEKQQMKTVLLAVRAKVNEGHSLATALAEFPWVFTELYRSTVAAGEQAGRLDMVLINLADYLERKQRLQQKIQSALIYPSIMSVIAIIIVSFLLVFVVPKMIAIFGQTGQELPFITQILITLSYVIKQFGLMIIAGLVILAIIINKA